MPKLFRPRISILTGLLLMTILGMAIVIWQLWHKVGPLQTEVKQLREERGTLVIEDPKTVNAIRIPSRFAGEGRTSFRVYIPPGQRYYAFVHINNVPKSGLPEPLKLPGHDMILGSFQGRLFARLDPGEHVVTLRTIRRGKTEDISLVVGSPNVGVPLDASAMTSKDGWPTVKPETYKVHGDGVTSHTTTAKGAEPFVLLRTRIEGVSEETVHVTYTIPEPDYPLDGLILWLERAQK